MFITLPSNASTDVYASNSANSYVVKLPDRLEFGHGWLVGLVEIHFPLTFEVVDQRRSAGFRFRIPIPRTLFRPRPRMFPPPHPRPTPPLNTTVPPQVQFPRPSQRAPTNTQLPFSGGKSPGLPPNIGSEDGEENGSSREIDYKLVIKDLELIKTLKTLQTSLDNVNTNIGALLTSKEDGAAIDTGVLYVYSDIVQAQVVGDVKAPLLRIVKIPSIKTHGLSAVATYDNPYYMPLGKREFNQIEIEIRDVAGNLAPFAYGTSIVTLHFKRE
jgi:hypothetical protein